ncbi:MAG: prolipoprotein diacylglyceryl transferase [bacterium]|nr:prolipoprotein diacylglyceryl transferase [bacterium]
MVEIPILKMVMLGPVMLYVWGFFVASSMVVAYLLGRKRIRKAGIDLKHLDNLFIYTSVSAFVGARLLWVLIEYKAYLADPLEILKIWNGGLAFTGGFVLAFLFVIYYTRRNKLDLLKITDALAFPLAVGMFIGRFGCLFSGLHPGIPASFGGVYNINGQYLAAWPFWAILNWFVASIVLYNAEKIIKRVGLLTIITVSWWGLWRFFGDFIRADAGVSGGDPRYLGLTPTQYLALLALTFIVFMFFKYKIYRKIR